MRCSAFRPGSTTRGLALLVAGLVTVTGCSSADNSGPGQSSEGGATSSSYYSPLQEYLSPTSTNSDADYAAMEKKVQEMVASCMRDQGFDYLPFVYPTATADVAFADDAYGSRDWVVKYGYGISTMTESGASTSSGPDVTDPNQAIVDAMSDSEREAYYAALYGGGMGVMAEASSAEAITSEAVSSDAVSTDVVSTDAVGSEVVGSEGAGGEPASSVEDLPSEAPGATAGTADGKPSMPSLEEQGCWGQAQAEVYGDQQGGEVNQDQFQDMWNAYSALYDQMAKDDRVAATVTDWIGCMSGAGYSDFTTIDAANMQANDKWAELNGWNMSDPEGGGGAVMSTSMAASDATTSQGPPADKVAEFRTYELKIALADFDCKESSKYAGVSDTVRIELEQKFLEDHKTELEQYRDQMNGGG